MEEQVTGSSKGFRKQILTAVLWCPYIPVSLEQLVSIFPFRIQCLTTPLFHSQTCSRFIDKFYARIIEEGEGVGRGQLIVRRSIKIH